MRITVERGKDKIEPGGGNRTPIDARDVCGTRYFAYLKLCKR